MVTRPTTRPTTSAPAMRTGPRSGGSVLKRLARRLNGDTSGWGLTGRYSTGGFRPKRAPEAGRAPFTRLSNGAVRTSVLLRDDLQPDLEHTVRDRSGDGQAAATVLP